MYVFLLRSDDGSDPWIDGVRVIDNDGLHGSLEKQGHAALAESVHEILVRWFNKTGAADLELLCAPLRSGAAGRAALSLSVIARLAVRWPLLQGSGRRAATGNRTHKCSFKNRRKETNRRDVNRVLSL